MDNFLKELNVKYGLEDFTGHLGVLLDDNAEEEDIAAAMEFIEDIYNMACKELG